MVTVLSPGEVVARVRRDAERNVLRVRNGLKHAAGVGRPQLTQTPKETVWSAEKVELWHYPSDRVRFRILPESVLGPVQERLSANEAASRPQLRPPPSSMRIGEGHRPDVLHPGGCRVVMPATAW